MNKKPEQIARTVKLRTLQTLSMLLGGFGLLLCITWLVFGPFSFVDFTNPIEALVVDFYVIFLFYIQHHGEKGTVSRVRYSINSGLCCLPLLFLWQKTGIVWFAALGPFSWFLYLVSFCAIIYCAWAARSMRPRDHFGFRELKSEMYDLPPKTYSFKVRGPYQCERHPIYLGALVLIWAVQVWTPE